MKNKNKVSIIICTYNRSKLLRKILFCLSSQFYQKDSFEVLVIDNNSSDDTKESVSIFKKDLNIKYFFEAKQGLSNARNRAVKESNGEYLAFLDDDALVSNDWAEKVVEVIEEKNPDIFGGPIFPFYDYKTPKWFLDKYDTSYLNISESDRYLGENEYLYGSNLIIKKEVFEKIGLFDPALGMSGSYLAFGEETDLLKRSFDHGLSIFYSTKIIVRHYTPKIKTRFLYIVKRNILTSFNSAINEKRKVKKIFFPILLKNLPRLMSSVFGIFFRDKIKFPYWQNYFLEKNLLYLRRVLESAIILLKFNGKTKI